MGFLALRIDFAARTHSEISMERTRMQPIFPFWFKQRQCKAETVGDENMLRRRSESGRSVHRHCQDGKQSLVRLYAGKCRWSRCSRHRAGVRRSQRCVGSRLRAISHQCDCVTDESNLVSRRSAARSACALRLTVWSLFLCFVCLLDLLIALLRSGELAQTGFLSRSQDFFRLRTFPSPAERLSDR